MNRELLERVMWEAHYSLKEGTEASYVHSSFSEIDKIKGRKEKAERTANLVAFNQQLGVEMLLPFKISFIKGDIAPVSGTGRGALKKVAQLKATFTRPEVSPYKIAKPFKVCTSIWRVPNYQCFYYGTIGLVKAEGQPPKDNGDLVVFFTSDWQEVGVYIFKGLANPNDCADLQGVVSYLDGVVYE